MKQSRRILRVCGECEKEFWIFRAWLRGGKAGKYCSRICAEKNRPPQKNYRVECICVICGGKYIVRRYRQFITKCCSRRCQRIHCGRLNSGENHPNWKGGISSRSWKAKKWERVVKKRDGYVCTVCSSKEGIQAHHIKRWEEYPELRYNISNGVTLCGQHHAKEHPGLEGMIEKGRKLSGNMNTCRFCGEKYYVVPYKIRISRFCSRKCLWAGMRKAPRDLSGKLLKY